MAEKRVLGPILDVLYDTMPRDNLLSSACLELFEFIKKENIKSLIKCLTHHHREKLLCLSDIDIFRDMIFRHDQAHNDTVEYLLDDEADGQSRRSMRSDSRILEHIDIGASVQEYWNTLDDEGGPERNALETSPAKRAAMVPQQPKPLVDYISDEETDMSSDNLATSPPSQAKSVPSKAGGTPSATPPRAVVPPPERLSEKRRREDGDDDELEKLLQHKRRSSTSAGSNASITPRSIVKRRKSFAQRPSPSDEPRKISINISPSLRTGGNLRADKES